MAVSESSAAQFDFGRVVSRTASLIGRNFVVFGILAVVFSGLPSIVIMLIQPQLIQSDPTMMMIVTLLVAVVSAVAGLVLQAALMRASIDDLSGKGVSLNTAFATAISMLLPLLGLGLLVGLGVAVGLILLIVPGVMLALRWAVAAPVMVVEQLGILKSMERSAALTKNHRWAIFGLIVFFVVIAIVMQMIVYLMIPGVAMSAMGGIGGAPPLLAVVLLSALSALMSLVATVGGASIYFELRQIKEGVGVTELAKVFA